MKTKFYGTLFLFLALTIHAYSDNVSVLPFSIKYGETKNVTIDLKNSENYTAFQMDLYLPKGLSIVMDGADYLVDLTARKSKTHTISCAKQSNGAIRIVAFSTTNALFSGTDSALVALTIKADDYLNSKDSLLSIRNISFVKVDSVETASQVNFPNAQTAVKLECFMTSGSVVYVPTAGQLSSLVDWNTDSLIVAGFINSTDFFTMRDMPNLKYLNLEGVTIVDGKIPDYLFYYYQHPLEEVIFPKSRYSIGEEAFNNSPNLKKVTFNEGLESLGDWAFGHCGSLSCELIFPSTLKIIGDATFSESNLKNVILNEGLESIGNWAFRGCDSLGGELVFPSTLKSIGESAFNDCPNLKKVNFNEGLESIGYDAFNRCSSLSGKLVFPSTLKSIGESAFFYCVSLEEVTLNGGNIGSYAFNYCAGLQKVTFNGGTIGSNAFYDCNSLYQVIFNEGVESIGDGAFNSCENIFGELVFPSTLKSIGRDPFSGCNRLYVCHISATVPPVVSDPNFCGNNLSTVFVPQGSGAAYRAADYWNTKIIVDGSVGVSVTLTLTEVGTLGEKALEKVEYLNQINKLKVIGPMNDEDWVLIRNSMTSLYSIDLSQAIFTSVPDGQFSGKIGLLDVILPEGLQTIGNSAFNTCCALTKMTLPSTVTSIGNQCFYNCDYLNRIVLPQNLQYLGAASFGSCDCLDSVIIPSGITAIQDYTFQDCYSLKELTLPNGLQSIEYAAFYYTALEQIEFPDALTVIDNHAFGKCYSLHTIILPPNLQSLGYYAFENSPIDSIILPASLTSFSYNVFSSSLKKITCLQPTPPILTEDPFGFVNKGSCELVVPSWSETSYKLANIWGNFYPISTYDAADIEYLTVRGELTLPDSARPTNKPNVSLLQNAQFTVRGEEAFSMKNYTQWHGLSYHWWDGDQSSYTSLVNESAAMRADTVCYYMSAAGNTWYFLSFPFDVKVSDIDVMDDAMFVIRKYDGSVRASLGAGSSWKNMTADSTLHAGQGYIIQFDRDVNKFVVPALDNQNKNKLFSNVTREIALDEYPSEFVHNRSWNFVGNPFPSYFDINYIDYSAPITVWDGSNYVALSLTDDQYVLKPMQAFFVQKPLDTEVIGFLPVGRQTVSTHIERNVGAVRSISSIEGRTLYNLTLSNETYSDKTRVVINPQASLAYEMTKDASKFMSENKAVPQLYSIDDQGTSLAINERPYATGVVKLGLFIGTEGTYTIALSNEPGQKVILVDKLLNTQTQLTASGYLFNSAAGTFTDRFELKFEDVTTGAIDENIIKSEVLSQDGEIIVIAEAGSKIAVYTETGVLKATLVAAGSHTLIQLESGVYMVQVNGESFKVVVAR